MSDSVVGNNPVLARAIQTTARRQVHLHRINEALVAHDIERLREMSRMPGGFLDDGVRRRCWMMVLNIAMPKGANVTLPSPAAFIDKNHPERKQVELDVDRSFVHYPEDVRPAYRKMKQNELSNVIQSIISRNPQLHYYQGFHDICTVLVLVLGERNAFLAGERLALFYLRDFMMKRLDPAMNYLAIIYVLLRHEAPEILALFKKHGIMPYFCLSWILTWLSHNITSYDLITRLFDFFISSSPIMPVYFVTKIILQRRKSIIRFDAKYKDSDDINMHQYLQNFPDPINEVNTEIFDGLRPTEVLDHLVEETWELFEKYPPRMVQQLQNSVDLGVWSSVNRYRIDLEIVDYGLLAETDIGDTSSINSSSDDSKVIGHFDRQISKVRTVLTRYVDAYEQQFEGKPRKSIIIPSPIAEFTAEGIDKQQLPAQRRRINRAPVGYAVVAASAAFFYYVAMDPEYQQWFFSLMTGGGQ